MKKSIFKKYQLKNGETRYKFQMYLGIDPATGKEKRTTRRGFKTEREAKVAYSRLQLEVEENGFGGMKPASKITFREFTENTWLPYYETTVKSSTVYKFKQRLNLIYDVFGDIYLDKITTLKCQQFVNDISVKYKRYRQTSNAADRILRYAFNLELISANPFDKVTYPPQRKSHANDIVTWTKEELNTFFDYIKSRPEQMQVMFRLLAYSGMRRGELMALRWSDIDFNKNTIHINLTMTRDETGVVFLAPKTENGLREIHMDDESMKQLRHYKLTQTKWLFARGYPPRDKEQLIFVTSQNKRRGETYTNKSLESILKEIDLPPMTIHGFRHTHCSLLFEAGASIKEVQARLGHSDFKTTMDIYTHVSEARKEKTITDLNNYLKLS